MPQRAEGIRIEPEPSEPWAGGPSPAAAAAPAPPEAGRGGEGPEPPRRRRAGSARGGAGGARQVPGVLARRAEEVVAHVLVAEVGGVRLPEEHAAARAEARRHPARLGGHVVLEELRAVGRADAGGRPEGLDGGGDGVQPPGGGPPP